MQSDDGVGGGAATYRYHNLFRDFLHEQLCQRDPTRYAELHLRAAKRFERGNNVEEAVYHYLAGDDYSDAAVLMERAAMEWFTRGRVETLLCWAEELPEEARAQAPRLSLYQSMVLTDRYDYEGARQALAHAEAGFVTRGDAVTLAWVHNQRATLGLFEGRYEDVISHAQAALEVLSQETVAARADAQRLVWKAEAQRLIGRAYVRLGRLADGVAKLQDALALYRQVGNPYDVVNLLQDLTLAFAPHGRFDEATACLNEALAIGRRLGSPTQLAGVLNNLGMLHYDRGEYREALALYEEGLAAARRGGDLRGQANI
ncbi:MAG: tetratricopeptide repeat protein, partial [Anaerolineae bacterium]|nr:tetratricopeptide repeat protein [Anaerolineae bacterium]